MKIEIGAVSPANSSWTNKTGAWRAFRPEVDDDKCTGCGLCETYCPDSSVVQEGKKVSIDYDYCKGCGICSHECPTGAINMVVEKK